MGHLSGSSLAAWVLKVSLGSNSCYSVSSTMILNIVFILNTVFVIGIMITVTITVNVTPGQPDLTCIAMLIHRRLKFK